MMSHSDDRWLLANEMEFRPAPPTVSLLFGSEYLSQHSHPPHQHQHHRTGTPAHPVTTVTSASSRHFYLSMNGKIVKINSHANTGTKDSDRILVCERYTPAAGQSEYTPLKPQNHPVLCLLADAATPLTHCCLYQWFVRVCTSFHNLTASRIRFTDRNFLLHVTPSATGYLTISLLLFFSVHVVVLTCQVAGCMRGESLSLVCDCCYCQQCR